MISMLAAGSDPRKRIPPAGRTWSLVLLVACLLLGLVWLIPRFVTKEQRLHGLLVDLELQGPDPSRYAELRDALTRRLPAEVESLRNVQISLDYAHFSDVKRELLDCRSVDFLVLSPQGTPWHKYQGEAAGGLAAGGLAAVKDLIRELIATGNMPILGICGGHQFLAMTFGGSVGFIDPGFGDSAPDRYPKGAIAERGAVSLETLKNDPIFEGLVHHPGRFLVMESHYEEVKTVPRSFVNLARSSLSEVQLIRFPGKIVYGVAFHPERGWDAGDESGGGKRILANFLRMVGTSK
jgi:GMP synthase (glutamine-hydrolysing)